MASIKPIEGRSIHQITSGQVIVDLNSVVKELVENALDAGATSIDVRFKNNGLDSIEVQDNGSGIASEDYETIALKHYTSKLATYGDLTSLTTFGFRGEALSSLCALSHFHITTARQDEAPRGKKLDFEISGKLKGTSVVASQKGTTIAVEELFHNLPVRRKELEKNIKREYSKVLGLLHAYACISPNVRLVVSNQMPKGKKVVAFSTKSNGTTKENIANVFGTKTLLAIIPLNLQLELQPTTSQALREFHSADGDDYRTVKIVGHISKPVFGEGRQAPDRQMFFVNSRPCALPQLSKAFNEVYKSFNVSQSPFIFADLQMNTNAYDVNVSPDKRTILLHDQTALLESVKDALTKLFEAQDQTVPQSQLHMKKLPAFQSLNVTRQASTASDGDQSPVVAKPNRGLQYGPSSPIREERDQPVSSASTALPTQNGNPLELMSRFVGRDLEEREEVEKQKLQQMIRRESRESRKQEPTAEKQQLVKKLTNQAESVGHKTSVPDQDDENSEEDSEADDPPTMAVPIISKPPHARPRTPAEISDMPVDVEVSNGITAVPEEDDSMSSAVPQIVQDFNARIASQRAKRTVPDGEGSADESEPEISQVTSTPKHLVPGVIPSAFARMRPPRTPQETATITIGSKTSTVDLGTPPSKKKRWVEIPSERRPPSSQFARFAAPGTQSTMHSSEGEESEEELPHKEAAANAMTRDKDAAVAKVSEDVDDASESEIEHNAKEEVVESISAGQLLDDDYVDEEEKKQQEQAKVQELIRLAEEDSVQPTQANIKRAAALLKNSAAKDATLDLLQFLEVDVPHIEQQVSRLYADMQAFVLDQRTAINATEALQSTQPSDEERLSLTISKPDFADMRIVGQFNLGFILAVRPSAPSGIATPAGTDDLFIIDQHASDEIYNFHRLSDTTILTAQRLVRPHVLELTAVEEETILAHTSTFTSNGFTIAFDDSGDAPVGRRCSLLTLPTSQNTTFTVRDLEELIALLTETTPGTGHIVRPSKVRKMLAMRACRSSVMIGKTLNKTGMKGVVKHMGEIDKPWNCPHGRPTMRHLAGLNDWSGWIEGDDGADYDDDSEQDTTWATYLTKRGEASPRKQEGTGDTAVDADTDGETQDGEDGNEVEDDLQISSDIGFT